MKIKIIKFNKKYEKSVLKFISKTDFTKRTKVSWRFNKMTGTIALDGKEIIGVLPFENVNLKFKNKYQKVLWISALYVNPKHRNKKIGTMLLSHAEKIFKNSFNYIFVMRHDLGTKAYQWYIKNNFSKIANIISLEKKIKKPVVKYKYKVLNNFSDFKKNGNLLLKSFNENNKNFDGFKKRTNKFWFNLKYHYYSSNYKFKIILENSKYFNYALVGKTKMRDNHYRLDILEYINNDVNNDSLLYLIEDYAFKNEIKKIRFQTIKSNIKKIKFLKSNFFTRWETNSLVKEISNAKVNFKNYKYFQTEYI